MVFVFKTSVKTKRQVKELKTHIDKILPRSKFHFDLEDCDNILRIDSEENIIPTIINLLEFHNFDCEELE